MVEVATLGTVAVFVKTLRSGGIHYNLKKQGVPAHVRARSAVKSALI